jgi:hypothetical protein
VITIVLAGLLENVPQRAILPITLGAIAFGEFGREWDNAL